MIPWLLIFLLGAILLAGLLPLLVRRGGRRVAPVDPDTLLRPFPAAVEVTRLDAHRLRLRWPGPAGPAEVFGGLSPDQIDFSRPIGRVVNENELVVPNPGRHRPYFARNFPGDAAPLLTAERQLPLKRAVNVRDIGGYPTEGGRPVAWGRVYRGGDLSRLNGDDLDYLAGLGLRLVCDLRTRREVSERPDRLPDGAGYRHVSINEEDRLFSRYLRTVLFNRAGLEELMGQLYLYMIGRRGAYLGRALAPLADPANLPLLFHCTAGKDRTGLAIALLLDLLGVPREIILADYTLSNLHYERLFHGFVAGNTHLRRLGVPMEELAALLVVNPRWLEEALATVHERFGSVEQYLQEAGGLTAGEIARIRENCRA